MTEKTYKIVKGDISDGYHTFGWMEKTERIEQENKRLKKENELLKEFVARVGSHDRIATFPLSRTSIKRLANKLLADLAKEDT